MAYKENLNVEIITYLSAGKEFSAFHISHPTPPASPITLKTKSALQTNKITNRGYEIFVEF